MEAYRQRVSTNELENLNRASLLSPVAADLLDARKELESLRAEREHLMAVVRAAVAISGDNPNVRDFDALHSAVSALSPSLAKAAAVSEGGQSGFHMRRRENVLTEQEVATLRAEREALMALAKATNRYARSMSGDHPLRLIVDTLPAALREEAKQP